MKDEAIIKRSNSLFEFEDLAWFPGTIRESMTDCLRFIVKILQLYTPIIPLIKEGLQKTSSDTIIDLCSGGGGAMEQIQKELNRNSEKQTKIFLTDKFPNINAFELIAEKSAGTISFCSLSVDAANVPGTMKGFRTIFSAFHHFNKPFAKSVIQSAVNANQGIGIFDGGEHGAFAIIGLILIHPFIFFFCTPFFKPFRLSRIIFTYIIPIIPFCQIWDGVISIVRLYTPEELLQMAHEVSTENYFWKSGKVKNNLGIHVTYLLGYPKQR